MIITKIEIQKKNKKRFSLFCQATYLFGVSEDTLLHFNIQKGRDYSETELLEIQNHENLVQCLAQAYRYLARRAHLETELIRKLRAKAYRKDVIVNAVKQLKKNNYLDDRSFISQFIKEEKRFKRNGPLLIYKKLLQKGANRDDIEALLGAAYPEEEQLENAQFLFTKKAASSNKPETQKIYAYLQQKGFSWDIIRQISENSV